MGYHALSEYLTERQRAAVVVDDQGCVMYRCRKTNARYVAAVPCCFVHIAAVSALCTNPSIPFSRDRRPAPSVQRTGAALVAVLCPCGRYIIPPGHVADTLVCSEGTTKCIAAMDRFIAMVIWDRPAQSPHAGRSRPRSLWSRRRRARCFILGTSSCAASSGARREHRRPRSASPAGGDAARHALAESSAHSSMVPSDRPEAFVVG
jgi:hypothetical protein